MKKVISVTRNIYWLYKPYLKYAKLTVIFSVIFGVIIMPLARVLAVCFPEMVMSSLSENAGFLKTFYLVLMVSAVQFVVPVFEDFFNICIRDKYNAKVEAHVKREVYEKALLTDYKYIDSPEFYDDYTWAVDEYSNRCKEAFLLFEDTISTVSIIVGLMVAALAEVPLAVFFALFSIIFRTWGYLKINRLELSRQNECIAYDRKRDYVHRTFYSRIYAADLKSTRLGDMLLRDYDRACAGKVCTIANYARKIFAWAFKCDLVYRISMILIIMSIVYSIYSGDIAETGAYVN